MPGRFQRGARLAHVGVFVEQGVEGIEQAALPAVAGQGAGRELLGQAQDHGVGYRDGCGFG